MAPKQQPKASEATPGRVVLTHPIEINGVDKTELRARHSFRMGDMAALQRYARRTGEKMDGGRLLDEGDVGAMLALIDSLCQLPEGTAQQIHPDDFPAVMEMLAPFLPGGNPCLATGSPRADTSR